MHRAEADQFYRELKGKQVRIGMEATWHSRWFERLLAELKFELWVGDPAQIRAKQVRKQKNDRRDAEHILKLMLEGNFPSIWAPSPENRDLRQLILHRHRNSDSPFVEGVGRPIKGSVISFTPSGYPGYPTCSIAWLNSSTLGSNWSSNSSSSCRRRDVQGSNDSDSSCFRPFALHSPFLRRMPSFIATAWS